MPTSDRCPYCRESVPADALVCGHCTREIATLRVAHAEIDDLRARLAAAEAAAGAAAIPARVAVSADGSLALQPAGAVQLPAGRGIAFATLWMLYLVPAVLNYGVGWPHTAYLTFSLAALAGSALALLANTNVWLVFLTAAAQPYVPLGILLAWRKLSLETIADPRLSALQVGLVAWLAALVSLAAFDRDRLAAMFRWSAVAEWMETHGARVELVQKFILAALGLGGVLVSLLKGVLG
ncbi:MAG TPA: zinc ribbon domain-containing protein [Longimicrobium sp.]